MYKAKFFRVANSLNPSDWKRFRKYVHGRPNKRSEVIALFLDHIFPAHPNFDAPCIERKALQALVFPDLPHSDQRLYDHLSYLYELLEEFLLAENRNRELIGSELVLADYFRRKGMVKDFELYAKKAARKLQAVPSSAEKALAGYRLASQQAALFSEQLKEQARTTADGLQEKMDALEVHFLRVRFQYACEMLNRQNVIGTTYDNAPIHVCDMCFGPLEIYFTNVLPVSTGACIFLFLISYVVISIPTYLSVDEDEYRNRMIKACYMIAALPFFALLAFVFGGIFDAVMIVRAF